MSKEVKQSYLNRARGDKFTLVFDVPPILKKISTTYNRGNSRVIPDSVQFSVHGTVVPSIVVKGVATRYAGDTLYVSSHNKDPYSPVNIKFSIDSGYNNYWVIYQWLNLLVDQKTARYNEGHLPIDGDFSDYQTNLTLYGLDENDEKVISFTYTKAFPTSLDEITFEQQNTGEMELKSGFTFLFSQIHLQLLGGERFASVID